MTANKRQIPAVCMVLLSMLIVLAGCGGQKTVTYETITEVVEEPEVPLSNDEIDIEVDCPDTITTAGYTVAVKDIYVKCLNTNQSTYDYDGNFMFISVEITGIKPDIDENDAYIFLNFDMYDTSGRYVGKTSPIYAGPLTDAKIGTVLNGDSLLSAYDVVKLVYSPY